MRNAAVTILAVALLAAPGAAAEPFSEAASGEWIVAAFRQLCIEPFGDRAKLSEAVAKAEPALSAIEENPALPMPGRSGWQSARMTLTYSDGTFLPKDLPSPQCVLRARAEAGYDHSAAAEALTRSLGLPPAKTRGKKGSFSSQWNFAGPNGEKRRIFLSQEPGRDGGRVHVALLNLR